MNVQSAALIILYLVLGAAPALAARPGDEREQNTSSKPGLERQDTGLSDPTVNPGQASDTRTVHGLVLRLQDQGYVIRDANGREVSVVIDAETTGDKELSAGDYVETKVAPQGRAITIIKHAQSEGTEAERSPSR